MLSVCARAALTANMKCVHLLVLWCLVTWCIGVPVYRGQDVTEIPQTGGQTFSYMSDIADMRIIRRQRGRKVVNLFKEEEKTSTSPITPSSLVSFIEKNTNIVKHLFF